MIKALRATDFVFSFATAAIGLFHTALVFKLFPKLGSNSFLFVGTGLAFINLGFLNIVRVVSPPRAPLQILCLIANLLAAIYTIVFYGHVNTLYLGFVVGFVVFALLACVDLRRLKQS